MSEIAWRNGTATIDGARVPCREAGDGAAVLCLHNGDAPPRALGFIAAHRRVVALSLPEGATARDLGATLASLGIERCDVLGVGQHAALALRLKRRRRIRVTALVLLGPRLLTEDGEAADPKDQAFLGEIGETARPCLALFGTRDETVPVACRAPLSRAYSRLQPGLRL